MNSNKVLAVQSIIRRAGSRATADLRCKCGGRVMNLVRFNNGKTGYACMLHNHPVYTHPGQ
jgi:hypothetical protein